MIFFVSSQKSRLDFNQSVDGVGGRWILIWLIGSAKVLKPLKLAAGREGAALQSCYMAIFHCLGPPGFIKLFFTAAPITYQACNAPARIAK